MSSYDKQYTVEEALFGAPYEAFEMFVAANALKGGTALDIGCGQGRDALMLAKYGYEVTAVDASKVGVQQMLNKAQQQGLSINGIVQDFYEYKPATTFDAIVFDSILHFEKADKEKELALLTRLSSSLNQNGFLFIFVHKSSKKENVLHTWLAEQGKAFQLVQEGYIEFVYEEKSRHFSSTFQMYMLILQKQQ